MKYYRIIATPQGPLATPLISGTIWGHMAWAIRYMEGEEALHQWLSEQTSRPWLFSSQIPKGMLPKPQLRPMAKSGALDTLETLVLRKRVRKLNYIPEGVFLRIREKVSEQTLMEALMAEPANAEVRESEATTIRLAHNRIDRRTGRTPDEGGLYFENAQMLRSSTQIQIFAQCPAACREQLQRLLDHIGTNGFGANASIGCGVIRFEVQEEVNLFAVTGNRSMSLSHGTLTANMGAVRYQQHVHFGKLGGHYALGAFSPFKHPILMMQPGATFTPSKDGPFGSLLEEVHPDPAFKTVRHHALHLPIHFTEAAS